jgi:predicted nucleotidyltransferase
LPSAGIVWVDRARVLNEARAVARALRERHPEIQRITLIGSFARGEGGPRSDLDLVVFVQSTPLAPRERVAHYAPTSARPVDLVVYTEEEVERMRQAPPPILREVLTRGIDL